MDESDREGSYCLDSRFDHGWLLYLYRFIDPGTCEIKGGTKNVGGSQTFGRTVV